MRRSQVGVRWRQGLSALGVLVLLLCWARPVAADFIYWSDTGLLSPGRTVFHIKRANLDGSGVQTILTSGGASSSIGGIAFDAANGYLYSGDRQFVFRTNLDGSGRVNLAPIGGPGGTGDVELDLAHGKIYWTTAGAIPTLVHSANLDGSGATTILSRSSFNFEGLAIDPGRGKLYYTIGDTIGVSNLDGSGQSVFKSLPAGSAPFDVEIDLANGRLYWGQEATAVPSQRLIRRANLDGSGGIEDLLSAGSDLFNNGINFDPADQKLYHSLTITAGSPLGLFQANADGTGDRQILNDPDGIDYIEVLHLASPPAAAVPEPATLLLLAAGLAGVLGHRLRRRRVT